jgi:hypothetical protein
MPIGILEVKLGRPDGMPQRRLWLLLKQTQQKCSTVRNATITHWLVWCRLHPDWMPGGEYEPPPRRIKRKPKLVDPATKPAKDPPYAPREFLTRELYCVGTAAAPTLNTSVASSCVKEVSEKLRAKTPYNHEGEARYTWQAILSSEISLPTWRSGKIPAPRSVTRLVYTEDKCSLKVSLLSRQSGYKLLAPTVNLHVSDLNTARRKILKRLASGDLRLADSQLVERKGIWYAQLCYDVPVMGLGLPVDRVLTILPSLPEGRRPFVAIWLDEQNGREKTWALGNGLPLVADYRRVVARRRALRDRYSDGCGTSHGTGRWARTIKPLSRYVVDMCSRFSKQTVADIMALALHERCGSIVYREPTMPVREHSWFAEQDVPMDWTAFEARLAFKCQVAGITYPDPRKNRIGMAEWRPKKEKNAG